MERLSPSLEKSTLQAKDYLDNIRDAWHKGRIDFRGRRNDEQIVIAEVLADEASTYMDQYARLFTEYSSSDAENQLSVEDKITEIFDEVHADKYREMKNTFMQAYVAIGVASQRAQRDNKRGINGKIVSLFDLDDAKRTEIMQQLFTDFQDLNTLRFGAIGSGVMRSFFSGQFDEEGNEVLTKRDVDQLSVNKLWESIRNRRYTEDFSANGTGRTVVHTAAKMHPEEYTKLRRENPETDKDTFDRIVNTSRNPGAVLSKEA